VTVNNVIILNNVFAAIKVETFNTFLGRFESLADHAVADWHIVIDAKALHDHRDAIALEDAHEVIFTRDEELSGTRIALTATTTAELIIDTTRIVTSSADHNETAELSNTLCELNIGTTTCHVGCESNCTLFTSLSNNRSLTLVVLCV